MEDTLRDMKQFDFIDLAGLNPCFNGRYSQSKNIIKMNILKSSLNPCFNGRYSQRCPKLIINHKTKS